MNPRRYILCAALPGTIIAAPLSIAAAQLGKQDYQTYCANCLGADGQGQWYGESNDWDVHNSRGYNAVCGYVRGQVSIR